MDASVFSREENVVFIIQNSIRAVSASPMGPAFITTMVQEATDEPSSTRLHPFFVKGTVSTNPTTPVPQIFDVADVSSIDHDTPNGGERSGEGSNKRRKTDTDFHFNGPETNSSLEKKEKEMRPLGVTLLGHFARPPADPSLPSTSNIELQALPQTTMIPRTNSKEEKLAIESNIDTLTDLSTVANCAPLDSKPRKTLVFNNKTGTLGSPPKPRKKLSPSKIVTVRYGSDEESRRRIGGRISDILEGRWQPPTTPPKKRGRPPRKTKQPGNQVTMILKDSTLSASVTRTGQPAQKKEEQRRKHSIFTSTPVSPRRNKMTDLEIRRIPQLGFKVNGTKIPGSMHPLWPARGMSHVHGNDEDSGREPAPQVDISIRKSKGQVTTIGPEESLLAQILCQLRLETIQGELYQDPANFSPVPPLLRLPHTHFESGKRMQRRIRDELDCRSFLQASEEAEGAPIPSVAITAHPAIECLYRSLEWNLSAYDRSTCESLPWTQKYAPATAAQVLQTGRDVTLLRDWLEALRVQSVDTGSSASKPSEAPKKKRRRKKLDDFVVDSDEEEGELDELSEDESQWAPSGQGLAKTVVRARGLQVRDGGRLPNAVVISGPHGSGKTGAVYAIAKELDFEVFEINSSSRRSGKDLLEKVGDMTRNHLVQQHRADKAASEEPGDDKTTDDIKSGKQGMMTAFFKPKQGAVKSHTPPPKKPTDLRPPGTEEKSAPSKNQRQSLILLEEVDVLYEEDKQFWTTLMSMIAQSRRPFIMTCNEESAVPLQSLQLYGIFRFAPPPVDLAVDMCLLIAANEGHALKRRSIASLYESRGYDLRATITELNYWCQIGVGDRKGGFDWFVSRWPKNTDLDHEGNVIRVISEDTYRPNMGWFGRDSLCNTSDLATEEELLHQSQSSWGLQMGDWSDTWDTSRWASQVSGPASPRQRTALLGYEQLCASLSDADVFSGHVQDKFSDPIDATMPELVSKARDDYVIGRTLLEADLTVHQASCRPAISISVKSLARNQLLLLSQQSLLPIAAPDWLRPIDESKAVSILEDSFRRSGASPMTRLDVALAFDPIAVGPTSKGLPSAHLDPSVFDSTMVSIVLDVAPWVRGIVAYDHNLMSERRKLSSLLSEGGSGNGSGSGSGRRKRMRTTRSAYSALEGGERRTTRRERYFGDDLVTGFVMRTGGDKWQEALPARVREEGTLREAGEEDGLESSRRSDESSS